MTIILYSVPAAGSETEECRGTPAEFLADNEGDEDVAEAIAALLAGAESVDIGGGGAAHIRLRLAPIAAVVLDVDGETHDPSRCPCPDCDAYRAEREGEEAFDESDRRNADRSAFVDDYLDARRARAEERE